MALRRSRRHAAHPQRQGFAEALAPSDSRLAEPAPLEEGHAWMIGLSDGKVFATPPLPEGVAVHKATVSSDGNGGDPDPAGQPTALRLRVVSRPLPTR
ncbi:MAG: hypothetical protein P8R54_04910 [Myxococcota bacterium]|nr:hypothetical protein [Myxococcota bacterium]